MHRERETHRDRDRACATRTGALCANDDADHDDDFGAHHPDENVSVQLRVRGGHLYEDINNCTRVRRHRPATIDRPVFASANRSHVSTKRI